MIFLPLVLNVLPDCLFIDAHGGDEVPSRPEALLGDGSSFLCERVVSFDGTLALEEAHDMGDGVFGWNGDEEVHVIRRHSPFEDFTLLLGSQFPDHLPDLDSDFSVESNLRNNEEKISLGRRGEKGDVFVLFKSRSPSPHIQSSRTLAVYSLKMYTIGEGDRR